MDGGHDQRICRIVAFEFADQNARVLGGLDGVSVVGEATVFPERLRTQLNSVNQKNDLIRIAGVGNELRGFEAGEGFAGAGGVPDISAPLAGVLPFRRATLSEIALAA